jgi:hypothetical protein
MEETSTVPGSASVGVPVDPPDVVVKVDKSPVTMLNDFSTENNIQVDYYVVRR